MKYKVVFFGASKFVIPLIDKLRSNFELGLVITKENKDTDAVPQYCLKNHVPYKNIQHFDDDTISSLKKINATCGVLAYFGIILPKEILNIFPNGIINIHPSLLPKYRGATPVQSAILNGDHETGVTIIKLDEKMDHGPILSRERESITQTDTTESLHDKLFRKGAEMLTDILPKYLSGSLIPFPQEDTETTYTRLSFSREDGYFDGTKPPPRSELDRMIRAFYPWPGTWTIIKIRDQAIQRVQDEKSDVKYNESSKLNREIRIKLLPENKIQVEGKRPMTYKDFINGYPELREKVNKFIDL